MKIVQKLTVVGAATGAMLAIGASSASAVTVLSEPGAIACGFVSVVGHTVTQSGQQCTVHATSTELVDLEAFGSTISRCDVEYDVTIDSNGNGYRHDQFLTGAECPVVPCGETGGAARPWPISISESGGGYVMVTTFCLQGSGTLNCTYTAPMTVTSHSLFSISGESPELSCAGTGGLLQIHGNYQTEGDSDAEFEIAM
jgi:hypothetical protein